MEILVGGSWGIWRVISRCFRRRLLSQRKKAVIRTRNSTKKIVEYIDNLRYFEFSGFSMMKTSGVSEFSKIQHFHSSVFGKLPRALSITVTNGDNASRFVWIIWIFFVSLELKSSFQIPFPAVHPRFRPAWQLLPRLRFLAEPHRSDAEIFGIGTFSGRFHDEQRSWSES